MIEPGSNWRHNSNELLYSVVCIAQGQSEGGHWNKDEDKAVVYQRDGRFFHRSVRGFEANFTLVHKAARMGQHAMAADHRAAEGY